MDETERARMLTELESKFAELYGSPPEIVCRAPGRVNLIGEHTDYNDGFVFPAAIDRDVLVALSRRDDRTVRAYALNFRSGTTFSLDNVALAEDSRERWSNYPRAMAWALQQEGIDLGGFNCATLGSVPLGAGLSSSAAILVACGLAFAVSAGVEIELVRLALLAQKAEREFVGVNVGIMDQFISALGQQNHALLIDTRSLTYESVPLPESGVSIVIADTNKKRGLVDSEYNARRSECEEAVRILQQKLPHITALRDVSPADLERYGDPLPPVILKRARHVVTEDARTLEGAAALKASDVSHFGELMYQSHESLKTDYEVSCPELDALVDAARETEGVIGARMTGAGFGGCTVNLVRSDSVERFVERVPPAYRVATGLSATVYVTAASQGASIVIRDS